jgi:hypothetical protein
MHILKNERQEQERAPSAQANDYLACDSYFHYQNEVVVPVLSALCVHATPAFCRWTRHIWRTRAQENILNQEWLVIFAEYENVSFTRRAKKNAFGAVIFPRWSIWTGMDFAFALATVDFHYVYQNYIYVPCRFTTIWPCFFVRTTILATSEYFWAIFCHSDGSCVSNPVAESHSASTFILILRPCTWVSD